MVSGGIYELTYSSSDVAWKLPAPSDGRTPAEISAGVTPVSFQYEPLNAFRYGATGNGTTDDTAALVLWVAVAKQMTAPTLVLPEGDFLISSTLNFDLPNYSTIDWRGRIKCGTAVTATAVRLGSPSSNIFGMRVVGAGVDVRRTTYDTAGSSIGLEVANLTWARIAHRFSEGFNVGVLLNGTNGGVSHCRVDLGYLHDNRYNLFLTASGSGYCNENSLYGGSFGFTSAWLSAAGNWTNTFDFYEDSFPASPLNNNKLFGPSWEAQSTTTVAASIYGQHTHVYGPRKETSAGTENDFKILLQSTSRSVFIAGGFGFYIGGITDSGLWNRYICTDGESAQTNAGATGTSHQIRAADNGEKGYVVKNTGGTEVFSVDAGGILRTNQLRAANAASGEAGYVSFGDATQSTVGAAGGASALPATPTGYLRFFIGTTEYVLPYYAQA
jgi:hypothetical protein